MKNQAIHDKTVTSSSIKTDKCVLCGADTGVPYYTPIFNRDYYMEGCGQLCQKCYDELYPQEKTPQKKHLLTPIRLEFLKKRYGL